MKKKTFYTILIIIFIVVLLFLCTMFYLKRKETSTDINVPSSSNKETISNKENNDKDNNIKENENTNKENTNKENTNINSSNETPEEQKEPIKENQESITSKPQDKIILIEDNSQANCASAIEYYYEDNNYKYYFTCVKSSSIIVTVNGNKYTIKEALNNDIVTMEELEQNGFKPLKEDKKLELY